MNALRWFSGLAIGASVAVVSVSACSEKSSERRADAPAFNSNDVSLSTRTPFQRTASSFESSRGDLLANVGERGEISVAQRGAPHPLSVATVFAGREGGDASSGAAALNSSIGSVDRTIGDVVESVEMRGEGVEVSWRMESQPRGAGDFVVRQRIQHEGAAERTRRGIRFPGEHLSVSDGTFIDASGRSIAVPAVLHGDTIEYRIAANIVESSAYPAVLDPTISSEKQIDPAVVSGQATQWRLGLPEYAFSREASWPSAYEASVAFDGTNYFVAWIERRGVTPVVYGALVSQAGVRLSSQEIVIDELLGAKRGYLDLFVPRFVNVTSGPGGFLVLWSKEAYGAMVGKRVSSAGQVVDAEPLTFDGPGYYAAAVTATSDAFAVAYAASLSSTEQTLEVELINGASVADPGIRKLQLGTTWDPTKDGSINQMRAAGDLIVYSRYQRVDNDNYYTTYTTRIGATLSAPNLLGGGGPRRQIYGFAKGGNRYFLTFYEWQPIGNSIYELRALEADGVTLSAPVSFSSIGEVYADANGLLVQNGNKLCPYTTSLVSSGPCFAPAGDGASTLAPGKVASPSQFFDLPARAGSLILNFQDRTTGAPSTPAYTTLSRSANAQVFPVVAYDPTSATYLAVWLDDSEADAPLNPGVLDGGIAAGGSGGQRLVGARIRSHEGALQADAPFNISAAGAYFVSDPKVIWDGKKFVVVWTETRVTGNAEYNQVMGATIPASGTSAGDLVVISASSSGGQFSVAVAADTTGRTIAWAEGQFDAARVYAKRWAFSDATPDSSTPLTISLRTKVSRFGVSAVFDGKQTIVGWFEGNFYLSSRISGVVFPDGSATPSSASFVLDSSFSKKENLRMATDGKGKSVIVWASTAGSGRREVRAKLIPRDKVVPTEDEAAASISVAPPSDDDNAYPSVAYSNDNESFFVAWSRGRANDWDIVGNWIALDGRVLDPAPGRVISSTTASAVDGDASGESAAVEDEALPELCTGPTATVGLAYVRFDSRSAMRSLRSRFRTVVSGRLSGETCGVNDDCASRYCVDGICCRTACNDGCGQCGGEGGGEKGMCAPKPSGARCGAASRFTCSGESTTCPSECNANDVSVCAPGFVCRDAQCTPFAATCFDDFTAITETGPVSCGGYRCAGGACKGTCESADDCAPGTVCDFKGRCGEPPPIENASGCSFVGSKSAGNGVGAVLAFVAAFLCRRTRKERRIKPSVYSH